MFEIKLTIEIPDLLEAVQLLKAAEPPVAPVAPYTAPAVPYTAPTVAVPDPNPVTPTVTKPVVQQAVSTTTAAPVPPVAAPTAAPSFTLAQVARAGATLLTSKPDLQKPLMELLGKYGAKTAQELPLDRLGEFAAELRQMGAQI